jgi:hypothetical protein
MALSRREARGGKGFAVSLLGVVLLLTAYVLLADWQHVPAAISSAFAGVHWRY